MDRVMTGTNEATGIDQEDFSRGKPVHFIIAGVTITVMFLVTLVTVVNLVV
jgi:hypothetical protein